MFADVLARIRAWFDGVSGRRPALPDPLRVAAQAAAPVQHRAPPSTPRQDDREREQRINQRARALAIRLFGANHPVDSPRDLFGRRRELDQLRSSVLDGSMHAVIYGPRGSGKTSLVRVFGDMADARGCSVIYLSCAGEGEFGDIMLPYLDEIEAASFGMRDDEYRQAVAAVAAMPTARSFASLLARIEGEDMILILDEFDRLENPVAKGQLALLIKLLADMRARVRLVFVGISGDVEDLIEVHASVRRHLVAVGLTPLADAEVEDFIRTTSRAVGITFTPPTIAMLRWLVCGSPYHMRLYSLQSCLVALDANTTTVDDSTALAGLGRAITAWQAMNARDGAIFEAIVTGRDLPLKAIETFATLAATTLEFTEADLADALRQSGQDESLTTRLLDAFARSVGRPSSGAQRLAFNDVLAPQFLLGMCAKARIGAREPAMAVEGRMQ